MKIKNITYIHVHKHIHTCTYTYMYAHIYGMWKLPLKIPLRLNRYNFQTVKAIDFLFSTLHTTPFLYGEIRFGVLQCMIPFGSPVIISLLKFGLWVQRFLYLSRQIVSCHIKRENVHIGTSLFTNQI